jgi:hypothetical protein
MIYRLRLAVLILAFMFGGACSEGDIAEDTSGADGPVNSDFGKTETILSDLDSQTEPQEIIFAKPDTIVELIDDMKLTDGITDLTDVPEVDQQLQCDAYPYQFGCPCDGNNDCASGWCVEGKGGKLCTMSCVEECPKGFSCTQVPGSCPDCEFICAPLFVDLCRPCMTNNECQQSGLISGNYCLDFEGAGNFCGAECSSGVSCPEGYVCTLANSVKGKEVEQCLPTDGQCLCSPSFIAVEASTACYNQNTYGKCDGERYCAESGLTVCDAPTPAPEECDGEDNDCDELFDEDEDICGGGMLCLCAGSDCGCVCSEGLTDCGEGFCVDTKTDVEHCGACSKPCDVPNVETYLCQNADCKIAKCVAGFENFNGKYDDGCECTINPEVCDGVDNDCDGAVDEGEEACPGMEDCVGSCVDGLCECSAGCDFCEGMCVTFLSYFEDPENCGYCGNNCALPNTIVYGCEGGNCYPISCEEGFADCDGQWPNGCEWTIEQEKCNCLDDDCDGEADELPLADCAPPKQCVNCFCQCPQDDPNIMNCGDAGCVDISSTPDHCGWCDNPCSDMEWPNVAQYGCELGLCNVLGCSNGFFDVNEQPWDGCECEKTSAAELCDFVDNNCNGEIDEAPFSDCAPPKTCDFGMCSCPLDQPNLQECVPNQCIDIFTSPKHCGFCDNDCKDMGWPNVMQYSCVDGMCGILACEMPWFNTNLMDFDGCECEKTSPSEICDMVDNNCNNEIDEFPNNCIPPKICQAGTCVCPPDQPHLQDCGNGQCTNTLTDSKNCGFCGNVCNLDNLSFQKCEEGQCVIPSCKPGWKDCNEIALDGCEFELAIEECNSFDDDCDGEVDENPMGINKPCETGLPGLCETGLTKCENGAIQCDPNIEPGQYGEICDHKDNDCNGQADDGNPGGGGPCSVPGAKGECKTGVLECQNGQLKCIQTVFQQEESCDGKDNDCDGVFDGISESCFTQCGNGTRLCNGGVWGQCSAMEPKLCKNYDNCQMEEMCVQQCPSAPKELCNGADDNCDGSIDESFACTIGQQKDQNCGMCGTQYSSCTGNCTWGPWGNCQGEGVCTQGQTKIDGSCEKCGQSQYACSNSCYWEYDKCINQGACSPGQNKLEGNCGNCGKKEYECSGSCSWQYVGCTNEGVCSPSATKYDGSCGNCGDQKWYCTNSCGWSKDQCVGQGSCSPNSTKYEGSCGDCGDNKYKCSNSCSWVKQSGCYYEGSCSPGDVNAIGCEKQVCTNSCYWSSSDYCGNFSGDLCACDSNCAKYGDCCSNASDICDVPTCSGNCGSLGDKDPALGGSYCWCDSSCVANGDCCGDAYEECNVQSCRNNCDSDPPSCKCSWCNSVYPKCCEDKDDWCG